MNYLISVTLLLFLIWPAYFALMRYSDRYRLNRFLLLLGMAAACAPTILFPKSPTPDATEVLQGTIEYVSSQAHQSLAVALKEETVNVAETPAQAYHPLEKATVKVPTTTVVYTLGLGLFAVILLFRLLFILALHLRSRPSADSRYRLLPASAAAGQAFTFGRTIFFSEDVTNDADFPHILAHEQVHARQLHSLDILLSELFLCAFWFHPAAWWLRAKLRANLEFLVDNAVLRSGSNRRAYQLALVRQSSVNQGLALALPFSEPSLKSRIIRMTGLQQHRLIGLIATVAVLFWLGMAAMMVNGRVSEPPQYLVTTERTFEQEVANSQLQQAGTIGGVEYLRIPYQNYYQALLPKQINSFQLYLRRLPTPDEYIQIRTILSHVPNTYFTVYPPCDGHEGTYKMQLGHWLNAEAVLNPGLQEDELLPHQLVFKLEPNGFGGGMRPEPHDAAGYFTPSMNLTVFKEQDLNAGKLDEVRDRYYPKEGAFAEDILPKGYGFTPDFRPDIAKEELVVFVNGERLKLMPPITSDISVMVNGRDLLDPANPATNIRIVEGGEEKTIGTAYATFAEMPLQPRVPANARLMCLLGVEELNWNVQRHLSFNSTSAHITWFNNLKLPADRNIQYWYNDKPVTRDFLLTSDFGTHNLFQVGYVPDDPTGDIIAQVVDDMMW